MSPLSKFKALIKCLNMYGIPLPLIRLDGKPTFTGTLTIISFVVAIIALIGKISGFLGNVDVSGSAYLFGMCLAAYLGRKMQGDGKGVTIESDQEKK